MENRVLQEELKTVGWYNGPLSTLKSEILEILLGIK